MKMRDLLVVLDGSARDKPVLSAAVSLARRNDAHLTGLCALEPLFPTDRDLAKQGYQQMIILREDFDWLEGQAIEKSKPIEAAFLEALRVEDVRGDWELAHGVASRSVTSRARAADLVFVGQPDPHDKATLFARELIEEAMLHSGRPVLLVPYAGTFPTIGSNVLVGWNDSRESARALHDALGLIDPAASITVLTSTDAKAAGKHDEVPAADVATHLARHGLKATVTRTVTDSTISPADALLGQAADMGADLLVVGGYGHSRRRELVFGGVTRDLLNHTTLPVLMSH